VPGEEIRILDLVISVQARPEQLQCGMVLANQTQSDFRPFIFEYLHWHDERATGPSLLRPFIRLLDPKGPIYCLNYLAVGDGDANGCRARTRDSGCPDV
jgi:hypothetical protein